MEEIIKEKLPENLINKIVTQYGKDLSDKIFSAYCLKKNVSLRVNTLKSNKEEVIRFFDENKIEYEFVDWYEDAFVLYDVSESDLEKTNLYEEGKIYLQN